MAVLSKPAAATKTMGMKAMKSNKTMKAMKGKAMDKAKLAMGQWAIRCQKPGCTSWVWLRAPSPPKGPHGRKATKAGAKAK